MPQSHSDSRSHVRYFSRKWVGGGYHVVVTGFFVADTELTLRSLFRENGPCVALTGQIYVKVWPRHWDRHIYNLNYFVSLKGKFSSGIEGALASTLNRDFNWKQLSEMILCIFLLMFSKFIWVTLIQKQQKKKRDFEFWAWASHFIMIWNITVRYKFWRTYLFQDA